jgi:hypothetical protein
MIAIEPNSKITASGEFFIKLSAGRGTPMIAQSKREQTTNFKLLDTQEKSQSSFPLWLSFITRLKP